MNLDLTTDLSTIDDQTRLKAMAYDTIAVREQAEGRLRVINQRILAIAGQAATGTEDGDDGAAKPTDQE